MFSKVWGDLQTQVSTGCDLKTLHYPSLLRSVAATALPKYDPVCSPRSVWLICSFLGCFMTRKTEPRASSLQSRGAPVHKYRDECQYFRRSVQLYFWFFKIKMEVKSPSPVTMVSSASDRRRWAWVTEYPIKHTLDVKLCLWSCVCRVSSIYEKQEEKHNKETTWRLWLTFCSHQTHWYPQRWKSHWIISMSVFTFHSGFWEVVGCKGTVHPYKCACSLFGVKSSSGCHRHRLDSSRRRGHFLQHREIIQQESETLQRGESI